MKGKQTTLYLMLGYPGAGKTTTAKLIAELMGAVHLWADKFRTERYPNPTHSHEENLELYTYLNELAATLLGEGQSVVFDTGFNFYRDRELLRGIASRHGAEIKLIWVQTTEDVARQRATHLIHAARNSYPEPMQTERFEHLVRDFEPPQGDEPYVKIDGRNVTTETVRSALELS